MSSTYDTDFYAWTQETAQRLRDGHSLSDSDLANVIEEIESLGKSDYRSLQGALRELIVHRLKWEYQQSKRSASWQRSINKQITKAEVMLGYSPSLKSKLVQILAEAYAQAVQQTTRETGMDKTLFPASCPFTVEQLFESGGPEQ